MRKYLTCSSPTNIVQRRHCSGPQLGSYAHAAAPALLLISIVPGSPPHQSLTRDYLAHCDLASGRQQRASNRVDNMPYLTVSRVERRNSALSDALRQASPTSLRVIGLGRITLPTLFVKWRRPARIRRCVRPNFPSIGRALTRFLEFGPCPSSDTPGASPLGDKLPYLDLPWSGC